MMQAARGLMFLGCKNSVMLPKTFIHPLLRSYMSSSAGAAGDIQKRVIQCLKKHEKLEKKELELKSKFSELGLDSLERVELIAQLEEEFNVTLENEQAEKIATVQDAVNAFGK